MRRNIQDAFTLLYRSGSFYVFHRRLRGGPRRRIPMASTSTSTATTPCATVHPRPRTDSRPASSTSGRLRGHRAARHYLDSAAWPARTAGASRVRSRRLHHQPRLRSSACASPQPVATMTLLRHGDTEVCPVRPCGTGQTPVWSKASLFELGTHHRRRDCSRSPAPPGRVDAGRRPMGEHRVWNNASPPLSGSPLVLLGAAISCVLRRSQLRVTGVPALPSAAAARDDLDALVPEAERVIGSVVGVAAGLLVARDDGVGKPEPQVAEPVRTVLAGEDRRLQVPSGGTCLESSGDATPVRATNERSGRWPVLRLLRHRSWYRESHAKEAMSSSPTCPTAVESPGMPVRARSYWAPPASPRVCSWVLPFR